jgi:hypothetical protein
LAAANPLLSYLFGRCEILKNKDNKKLISYIAQIYLTEEFLSSYKNLLIVNFEIGGDKDLKDILNKYKIDDKFRFHIPYHSGNIKMKLHSLFDLAMYFNCFKLAKNICVKKLEKECNIERVCEMLTWTVFKNNLDINKKIVSYYCSRTGTGSDTFCIFISNCFIINDKTIKREEIKEWISSGLYEPSCLKKYISHGNIRRVNDDLFTEREENEWIKLPPILTSILLEIEREYEELMDTRDLLFYSFKKINQPYQLMPISLNDID